MGCLLISDSGRKDLEAGAFSNWLETTRSALKHEQATDVPCGDCTACCRSSYFINIRPDEYETLAHIPSDLLFPAPGQPKGNVLMGFDENGHCPMLKEGTCSIYEHRPLTCRSYDCRIFPATGVHIAGKDKAAIAHQVKRWEFSLPGEKDTQLLSSVRKSASFLRTRSKMFPEGELPANSTQLSIMAIKVHELFMDTDIDSREDSKMVEAVIKARNSFDKKD